MAERRRQLDNNNNDRQLHEVLSGLDLLLAIKGNGARAIEARQNIVRQARLNIQNILDIGDSKIAILNVKFAPRHPRALLLPAQEHPAQWYQVRDRHISTYHDLFEGIDPFLEAEDVDQNVNIVTNNVNALSDLVTEVHKTVASLIKYAYQAVDVDPFGPVGPAGQASARTPKTKKKSKKKSKKKKSKKKKSNKKKKGSKNKKRKRTVRRKKR
jgi:hypothetical protein